MDPQDLVMRIRKIHAEIRQQVMVHMGSQSVEDLSRVAAETEGDDPVPGLFTLDSPVKGWTIYDGTGKTHATTGDSTEPPYENGLHALLDGWRVIQFPQLIPPYPDTEYTTSFQKNEFIFERLEEID